MKTFERNSTAHQVQSSIAESLGLDFFSDNLISANSTLINLTIPSREVGQQITVLKNIYYTNQTSRSVEYTIEIEVINSGGIDLTGISVLDLDDLSLSELIELNRTQTWNYSDSVVINKAQSNTEHSFSIASATANLITYNSPQIKIIIPGYGGGPNDVYISAPTSAGVNTNFNVSFTIKNVNLDIGQDFVLNYWLLSNDELVTHSTGAQTLFVGANDATNSTTISFLAPSEAQTYKIRANVTGEGVVVQATALSTISIVSGDIPENPESSSGGSSSIIGRVTEEIVCNSPYIRYGKECCLDVNNNSICDRDEVLKSPDKEDETLDKEIQDKEIPKEEFQFFESIKEIAKDIGNFFSLISKSMQENKNYLFIGGALISFFLITLLVIKLIKTALKRKPKESSRLKNVIGREVYAENGDKIGKIIEVYLEKNRVYGWLIKPDKKISKKLRKKKFLITHKDVKSIGNIMIISERVAEHLEKLTSKVD